jgi:hypothetical protein
MHLLSPMLHVLPISSSLIWSPQYICEVWWFLPVRKESIVFVTEHNAYIGGMVDGGIEVSVVSNMDWEMHCCFWLRNKCPGTQHRNDYVGDTVALNCGTKSIYDIMRATLLLLVLWTELDAHIETEWIHERFCP